MFFDFAYPQAGLYPYKNKNLYGQDKEEYQLKAHQRQYDMHMLAHYNGHCTRKIIPSSELRIALWHLSLLSVLLIC